ncbi:MAG: zinc ribbon domain-containing protein [Actinomycetes bacterium]|jgi:DNA repair exonuclease SbcCD ATPase subunit|nr:zinc ribbon domain-containing protein [Actinomycetes bacterium]
MANDMLGGLGALGGLGDLLGGVTKLMPQDDPNIKMFNAQKEVSDLQKQAEEVYAEIGRKVYEADGAAAYPALADKLKLIQANLASAQEQAGAVQAEVDAANARAEEEKAAQAAAVAGRTCPSCGTVNAEGIKFCNECGTKLGESAKVYCPSCGAEAAAGTRFCGSCGANLGG